MAWHGTVVRTEWLTPTLVSVVLGGDGLAGFTVPAATDAYVNLAIPPDGATYGPVFDPAEVKDRVERDRWPARRRYTVRAWDGGAGELTLDMVVHGDSGAAGPWAARCRPGDVLVFEGPGGGVRARPGGRVAPARRRRVGAARDRRQPRGPADRRARRRPARLRRP